ncbi:TPA: hypothetical protein ACSP2F_002634 [Aeromonas veronii]
MSKLYIVMAAVFFLSGCASNTYPVTYATDPEGAELFCNGVGQGDFTPLTLYYTLDKETKERGTLNTVQCEARWRSGVTAQANSQFNLGEFPNGVIVTIPRPNAEGYAADAEYALKIRQFKYQLAKDRAAANAKIWKDLNQTIKDATPKTTRTNCYGVFGGVNCTSTSY